LKVNGTTTTVSCKTLGASCKEKDKNMTFWVEERESSSTVWFNKINGCDVNGQIRPAPPVTLPTLFVLNSFPSHFIYITLQLHTQLFYFIYLSIIYRFNLINEWWIHMRCWFNSNSRSVTKFPFHFHFHTIHYHHPHTIPQLFWIIIPFYKSIYSILLLLSAVFAFSMYQRRSCMHW
jgi:hypothetical protein